MAGNITEIDLTQPLSTVSFLDKNTIVHKSSFDELDELLNKIIKNNQPNPSKNQGCTTPLMKQLYRQTVNNTIFIHHNSGNDCSAVMFQGQRTDLGILRVVDGLCQ